MFEWIFTHTPLFYFVQSMWRDEAFSVLMSEKPLGFIMQHAGFEPPVYYILLHVWMLLFGQSEIATRSLSLLGFALATYIVIIWSARLFPKHWLRVFTPLFFFVNPMLLYYAFEVRTYGWYIFFATATLYHFYIKNWKLFIVFSILGLYTHIYFLFFFIPLGLYSLFVLEKKYRRIAFTSLSLIGIGILPWIIKIIQQIPKLKESWYYPADMQLVRSVLGNMFIGYEGTPWYGWKYTSTLSLLLVMLMLLTTRDKKNSKKNILFIAFALLPLLLVVGVSFIKPIFVNRYLIPTTIAMVFIVSSAIAAIPNNILQKILAGIALIFVVWFNIWFPQQHPKLDIRTTLAHVNQLKNPDDVIFASNPIIFMETKYYAQDRSKVYLYNPNLDVFPWFIGDAIVSQNDYATTMPLYPIKAYVINEDATIDISYTTY